MAPQLPLTPLSKIITGPWGITATTQRIPAPGDLFRRIMWWVSHYLSGFPPSTAISATASIGTGYLPLHTKWISIIFLFTFTALTSIPAFSQGPTHLYLFSLAETKDNKFYVFDARYMSAFNPGGYTNQPYFLANNDLLVSVRKAGEKQNDIWLLSTATRRVRQLTKTEWNEFSPQLVPGREYYSVVRQVEGEPIDQQVFQFPVKGGSYTSVTPDVHNIGYYAWLTNGNLALYTIENESNRLVSYSIKSHQTKRLTTAIGRTLVGDENASVYYVHKFNETYWYIKRYNEASTAIDVISETTAKAEDFAIAPDGTFFMGNNQRLMYQLPGNRDNWQLCADLSIYGIRHITRMAISSDGKFLALVAAAE